MMMYMCLCTVHVYLCMCVSVCVCIYLYVDICMLCTYMCKLKTWKNAHTEVWALLLYGAEMLRLREESRHIA